MKPLVGVLKDDSIFQNYHVKGGDVEKRELKNFKVILVRKSEKKILKKLTCLMAWDKPSIDKNLIESLANCQLIVRNSVGLDNVDADYARQKGIEVRNVADYGTREVAVHALSFILHAYRRLSLGSYRVIRKRIWNSSHLWDIHEPGQFLIGVVGLGKIGSQVAEFCSHLGFKVCFYDPYVNNEKYRKVRFDELKNCDLISIHCPLTDGTIHLFAV